MTVDLLRISNRVLSSLVDTGDEGVLKGLLPVLAESSIATHKEVYEGALAFIEKHQKWPTADWIKAEFPIEFEVVPGPYSKDHLVDLSYHLKLEKAQGAALASISKGAIQDAVQHLNSVRPQVKRESFTVDNIVSSYQEMKSRPSGILLGIPEVDEKLKGCSYGTMTVIAAPPSMGKSTLMTSAIYAAVVKSGFNFVLITFEIMARDCWFNFMARHANEMGIKLSAELLKKGFLTPEQEEQLALVVADWKLSCKGKLRIVTPSEIEGFTKGHLDAFWARMDAEMGGTLDGYAIDYLQLTRHFRPERAQVDEFMNDMCRYHTDLATNWKGNRGLVGIILSQINRDGERKLLKTRRADKTSFAEVNALERDAHAGVVIFADEAMRLSNTVNAQIVKNRSGQVMSEMVSTFVDWEAFTVGSQNYQGIFSEQAVDILGTAGDDFFN